MIGLVLRFTALAIIAVAVGALRWSGGSLSTTVRATVAAGVLFSLAFLTIEALCDLWSNRPALAPRRPRRRVAPAVVAPPEPPVMFLVTANWCRVCNRHLEDPRSRREGVDAACRRVHGPRPVVEPSPEHIVWGEQLHAARLQQRETQRRLDAEFAVAEREWRLRKQVWELQRRSPAGLLRRRRRGMAVRLLVVAGVVIGFTLRCGVMHPAYLLRVEVDTPRGAAAPRDDSPTMPSAPHGVPGAEGTAPRQGARGAT